MGRIKTKRFKIKYLKILKISIFYLILAYLIIFFLINMLEIKIAFEYDGVIVDSSKVFEYAGSKNEDVKTDEYWTTVNSAYNLEKRDSRAVFIASILKIIGFDIVFVAFRSITGSENLINDWRWLPDNILFESKDTLNDLFESANYKVYFYNTQFPNKEIISRNMFLIDFDKLNKRIKTLFKF